MMEIGPQDDPITVEPLENPFEQPADPRRVTQPAPVETPAPAPVKTPEPVR
jgi:hypothetical protein